MELFFSTLISKKLLYLTKVLHAVSPTCSAAPSCVIRHETGGDVSPATFSHRSMSKDSFTSIHGPQRMDPSDATDPQTFPLVSPWGCHLWFRVKYIDSCWRACQDICDRYSRSSEGDSYWLWLSSDFFSATVRLTFLVVIEISWQILDGLLWSSVQTFVASRGWILKALIPWNTCKMNDGPISLSLALCFRLNRQC